jgi:hypothetical protein
VQKTPNQGRLAIVDAPGSSDAKQFGVQILLEKGGEAVVRPVLHVRDHQK